MVITNREELAVFRKEIMANAKKAMEELKRNAEALTAVRFFGLIKFEKIGKDPITGKPLNLIEQINQMYSDLVVLTGIADLLEKFPKKQFQLNMGSASGYDIASTDGQVVAECFAVTSVTSNDKFNKDCKKLMKASAEYKFLYFYTYSDSDKVIENRVAKYPQIHITRVDSFEE